MNRHGDAVPGVIIFILWSLVMFFIGAAAGEDRTRREAVRVGAAKYTSAEDGSASFTWIVPAEAHK